MGSSVEHQRSHCRHFGLLVALCLVLMGLVGCGDIPIAEDVNHSQAREIVAALSRKGISATFQQERKGSGRYQVTVTKGDFGESVRVLDDQGLPEEPREAFLQTLSTNSFLPDSREVEALRLDYALAVQLEELIENFPEVKGVRAIVRYHLVGDGAEGKAGESERAASLVVRIDEGAEVNEDEMRKIVFSVIPGLAENSLHISYHEQPVESEAGESAEEATVVPFETFMFGWRVAKQDYTGLALSLLGLVALFGIAGALAGYYFGLVMNSSGDAVEEMQELKSTAFQIESRRREELPEVTL